MNEHSEYYTKSAFMEDIRKSESKKSDSQKPSDGASPLTKAKSNPLEIDVEDKSDAPPARVTGRSYIGDNNFAFGVKSNSDPPGVIDGFQSYLRKRNETKSALLHDSDMSQITGMISNLN